MMKTVAKAVLYDGAGKVLCLRRSGTHPHFPFHADFPGGEVEPGEHPVMAVVREIMEETGMHIPQQYLQLAHSKQHANNIWHLVFTARLPHISPHIQVSWEHDQFEWIFPYKLVQRPMPAYPDNYYETALEYLRAV